MLLPGGIKIRCKDGEIICDRLLFILWSKQWRDILDPHEEETVIIIPDLRTRVLNIFLKLLMTGRTSGLEIDFENFFDLAVDFLSDLPGGFTNFESSKKSLELKGICIKNRRKKFKVSKQSTCEFCLSKFSSIQAKNKHIENYHQPKQVHECSTCKLTFKSREGLITHQKTKHDNQEKLECSACFEKFTNETNLKRHFEIKHRNRRWKCFRCSKVFENHIEFKEHHIDKHNNTFEKYTTLDKKDFKCKDCKFATTRKDSLLRHRRLIHCFYRKDFPAIQDTLDSENSNWTCSKCDKTFTSNEEIENHVIACEDIKCRLCDKSFTLKSNLKRHIEKKHPYICKNCNERFRTRKLLGTHEKTCQLEKAKQ